MKTDEYIKLSCKLINDYTEKRYLSDDLYDRYTDVLQSWTFYRNNDQQVIEVGLKIIGLIQADPFYTIDNKYINILNAVKLN